MLSQAILEMLGAKREMWHTARTHKKIASLPMANWLLTIFLQGRLKAATELYHIRSKLDTPVYKSVSVI